jgi:NAD(P)H-hydrate epimerase
MKRVDDETIKRFCPGRELMERAGRKVARFIIDRYPRNGFKAAIFVGPGNNGGDALVVARHLSEEGLGCSVHCLTSQEKFTPDAFKNYQRLQPLVDSHKNLKENSSTRRDWMRVLKKDLVDATVIVDGLFGTGLARGLEGRALEVVRLINATGVPVVSIDIPSGIHGDTGAILIVTMGHPKLGMLFHPGKSCVGEMIVADIGFPEEVIREHSMGIHLLGVAQAALSLPSRAPDAHKYQCGTLLLISGSGEYTGATQLAAEAAPRSGCGMVYAVVPEGIRAVVETGLREAITVPMPETASGTFSPDALPALAPYLKKADAVVIGPGLGRNDETDRFVHAFVKRCDKPLVIDADGINAFVRTRDALTSLSIPVVLTPHSGELQRLLGQPVPRVPLEVIEADRETAKSMGVTLIHKAAPSLIASPDGTVWISLHGNSALASAGTGDVLAGLVGGIAAQGATGVDAACTACFLHGRAGEYASKLLGVRGVIAGDLLRILGSPMVELEGLSGKQ